MTVAALHHYTIRCTAAEVDGLADFYTREQMSQEILKVEHYLEANRKQYHIKQIYSFFSEQGGGDAGTRLQFHENEVENTKPLVEAISKALPKSAKAEISMGQDEGGGGGDVEGADPAPAGPAGVHQVVAVGNGQRDHRPAEDGHGPGDLLPRLPLGPEAHQEGRGIAILGLSRDKHSKRGGGLGRRQRAAFGKPFERLGEGWSGVGQLGGDRGNVRRPQKGRTRATKW